jgi:hypothetical protein
MNSENENEFNRQSKKYKSRLPGEYPVALCNWQNKHLMLYKKIPS